MLKAIRRLKTELQAMEENPDDGVSAGPVNESDIFQWKATIQGPKDTPYEGGVFSISIRLNWSYPFTPPKLRFETPIYHPNISSDGRICLDILKERWSAALTLSKLLLSVMSLLSDPNANDPLVFSVAELYRSDYSDFERVAKEWTRKYARQATKESSATSTDERTTSCS